MDRACAAAASLDKATAEYLLGRVEWKRGNRASAIAHYEASAQLQPGGAGAVALEQVRAIMDFYNKDLYNP